MLMTKFEISKFYRNLDNGDKGRFTAYVSMELGQTPFTWQKRLLSWIQDKKRRQLSPIIEDRLVHIIQNEEWKLYNEEKNRII